MKSLMGIFLLGITLLISTGCTIQEERTYTDTELQSLRDGATDLWSGGNIELVSTLYSDDCVRHNADVGDSNGPEEVKEFVKWVYNAYSDFKVTFGDPMKFEDGFAVLWTATGTNDGPLNENMPATGKKVEFNGVGIVKIEGGKYVEEWVYYNQLYIYNQMGYELELEDEEDDEDDD